MFAIVAPLAACMKDAELAPPNAFIALPSVATTSSSSASLEEKTPASSFLIFVAAARSLPLEEIASTRSAIFESQTETSLVSSPIMASSLLFCADAVVISFCFSLDVSSHHSKYSS